MIVKLLTEHHLEFLSLKGGCSGSSESTHVKMPHCWESYALAQLYKKVGITYMCVVPLLPLKVDVVSTVDVVVGVVVVVVVV